ncbi:hypothetical protein PNQ92_13235 [Halobacterium salinarum]|uniref:hypothetical protein n=1 Tax=Halobacterium salinarum TaxID=2242 RepID=UPI002553483C|nr:hypothetical protein [Halobacterium salinarum]MDL0126365.1 hypothetical protein [Halobacterium salinarum]
MKNILYYGYNPNCERAGLEERLRSAVQNQRTTQPTEHEMIKTGTDAFVSSISAEIKQYSSKRKHIVPISSGLDSRAILGGLINNPCIDKSNITTISFGTQGTWDFEIGQQIAHSVGVNNIAIDLTSSDFDWSEESLRKHTHSLDCPTRIFESYVNHEVVTEFHEGAVIWSGFFGDPSIGSHQPKDPCDNWELACERFAEYNRFSPHLAKKVSSPTMGLPRAPHLPKEKLSFEEQLDFAHRQKCFIKPLIFSETKEYATPFLRSEWLEFALNLPKEYRQDRSIYVEVMSELYPNLFEFPTDMNYGLGPSVGKIRWYTQLAKLFLAKSVNSVLDTDYIYPGTNYMDFDREFRRGGCLYQTGKSLMLKLDKRGYSQINAGELWQRHQQGHDFNRAIRTLCLLELLIESPNGELNI